MEQYPAAKHNVNNDQNDDNLHFYPACVPTADDDDDDHGRQ